jgi:HEAT repeat protein
MTRRRKLVLGVLAAALALAWPAREAAILLRLPLPVAWRMPLHARIPAGLDADILAAVEDCYAPDPETRARAAHRLGNRAARAAPAIPQLIALLADEPQSPAEESAGGLWGVEWKAWADTPLVGWFARLLIPKDFEYVRDAGPEACSALVEIGFASVEPLIAALNDPLPRVRMYAATALANIADPRAVEPLIARLSDDDYRPTMAATLALGQFADDRAARALDAMLRHPPTRHGESSPGYPWAPSHREAAAQALAFMGPPGWAPLLTALRDADADVRRGAAAGIAGRLSGWPVEEPGDATPLARALAPLLADPDEAVSEEAARGLAYVPQDWAALALYEALDDSRKDVRERAASALLDSEAPSVADLLARLLERPGLRTKAACRLAALGDGRAAGPLLEALDSLDERRDTIARDGVARALARLHDARTARALMRLAANKGFGGNYSYSMESGEWFDQMQGDDSVGIVAGALVAIGPPAIEPLLQTFDEPVLHDFAIDCLGRIGDARAVPALLEVLRGTAEMVFARAPAADALARIRDERVVPALLEALESGDDDLRRQVLVALGRTGDARTLAPLLDALQDDDRAKYAAAGLGLLGDARAIAPLRAKFRRLEATPEDAPDEAGFWTMGGDSILEAVLLALLRLKDVEAVPLALERWDRSEYDIMTSDQVTDKEEEAEYFYLPDNAHELVVAIGPAAVPALTAAMDDPRKRAAAVGALLDMDCPEAVDALRKIFNDEDADPWRERLSLRTGFVWAGRHDTVPTATLVAALADHKDRYVRVEAAELLRERADTRAVDAIRRAMREDPCLSVRRSAAVSLWRLTGEPLPPEFPRRWIDLEAPLCPVMGDHWY